MSIHQQLLIRQTVTSPPFALYAYIVSLLVQLHGKTRKVINIRSTKEYTRNKGTIPLIRNLGTRWRRVFNPYRTNVENRVSS